MRGQPLRVSRDRRQHDARIVQDGTAVGEGDHEGGRGSKPRRSLDLGRARRRPSRVASNVPPRESPPPLRSPPPHQRWGGDEGTHPRIEAGIHGAPHPRLRPPRA